VGRIALVARLRPGSEERASELIGKGPPFNPGERGFDRHVVFLSAGEVVFVFEGDEVEWLVEGMVDEPAGGGMASALEEWRELVEGPPRIARAVYAWEGD
jgi:hypothetical protein